MLPIRVRWKFNSEVKRSLDFVNRRQLKNSKVLSKALMILKDFTTMTTFIQVNDLVQRRNDIKRHLIDYRYKMIFIFNKSCKTFPSIAHKAINSSFWEKMRTMFVIQSFFKYTMNELTNHLLCFIQRYLVIDVLIKIFRMMCNIKWKEFLAKHSLP